MLEYFICFLGMFVVDIFHAIYIKNVQNNNPFIAALYSGMIYILYSWVTINYVNDPFILIPATLGAASGTFSGVIINKFFKS